MFKSVIVVPFLLALPTYTQAAPLPQIPEITPDSSIQVSPSSAYFGQVPVGYEEQRDLKICSSLLSNDNLLKLQISDPAYAHVFQITDHEWKDNCLAVSLLFRPDISQSNSYQVYGELTLQEKYQYARDNNWRNAGIQLQAVLSDAVIDLAPVMGTGVSDATWNQVIIPSGWRYAGHLTYEKQVAGAHNKFLTFKSADLYNNTIIASTYDQKNLLELKLDHQNIPVYNYFHKYQLGYGSQRNWVRTYPLKQLVATSGTQGSLSLWKKNRNKWKQQQLSGNSSHSSFVNFSYQPVFNREGSCLLAPHTNNKHLRRIQISITGKAIELEPYLAGVRGLSHSPEQSIYYIGENQGSVYECQLQASTCEVSNCRLLPNSEGWAYATDVSNDGRWLAASYYANGPKIKIWKRESDRVIDETTTTLNFPSTWPAIPNIKFHKDSQQFFIFNRTTLLVLKLSDNDQFEKIAEYDLSNPQFATRSGYPVSVFGDILLAPNGRRAFFTVNLLEGGFVMFDQLEDGLSPYLQKVSD